MSGSEVSECPVRKAFDRSEHQPYGASMVGKEPKLAARNSEGACGETPLAARCVDEEELRLLLHRALGGDPLGLEKLVTRLLREEALILDHEFLVERTRMHLAHHISVRGLKELGDALIQTSIEEAARHVLEEDREALRAQLPIDFSEDERFTFITKGLGVATGRARRASVDYNALPARTRRAFQHVVLDREELQDLIGEEWETESALREAVCSALGAILGHDPCDSTWSSQA